MVVIFSSCTYGVQWAHGIPMCPSVYLSRPIYLDLYIHPSIYLPIYLSVCLSLRPQLEKMLLLEYALIDFRDTWIQWSSGGETIKRGVQEFGVKGHVGVIWSRCSNMLKTLLRLHDSIDSDETWVKRSLARGSFGMFRKFWLVLGSLGVAFDQNCSPRVKLI